MDSDDNNDLSQPLDGDIANHIAKLISSLTETEITSLAETALSRLAETALSRLPKAEIDRILVPFLQPVFCRMTEALFFGLSDSFTRFREQLYREVGVPIFTFFLCGCVGMISIDCGRNIYEWRSKKQLLSSKVTANAAKLERPKPKRSIFLSRYTSNPDQGLKCIGKVYIEVEETAKDVIQEVEQHQEGTSRAVAPSSGPTVDDPYSLS